MKFWSIGPYPCFGSQAFSSSVPTEDGQSHELNKGMQNPLWHLILNTNLTALFLASRHLAPCSTKGLGGVFDGCCWSRRGEALTP